MAQPQRTADSLIFGTPARLCTSGDPRYMWTTTHVHIMCNWIKNNPTGYDDLETLLQALDLHGFGPDILDFNNRPVRDIIYTKVKSKISKLRLQLKDGWAPPPLPQDANTGPGNEFNPRYNINIINPDGP
ncbi:hypothetical protein F4859DRAFT_174125 [Xylaria cf. heliscus]|nr:hypothetical protein F4859DRAFT_174125 [Xylaria cf. heliscus]